MNYPKKGISICCRVARVILDFSFSYLLTSILYWCGFFKIVIRKKDFLRFDNKTMPNFIIDFTNDFFLQFICFFQHNTDENNSTGYIKPKQKPPRPGMCNEQFIK